MADAMQVQVVDQPPVTVNGRLAMIILKLLQAADDITLPDAVKITVHCRGNRVTVEVPRRY